MASRPGAGPRRAAPGRGRRPAGPAADRGGRGAAPPRPGADRGREVPRGRPGRRGADPGGTRPRAHPVGRRRPERGDPDAAGHRAPAAGTPARCRGARPVAPDHEHLGLAARRRRARVRDSGRHRPVPGRRGRGPGGGGDVPARGPGRRAQLRRRPGGGRRRSGARAGVRDNCPRAPTRRVRGHRPKGGPVTDHVEVRSGAYYDSVSLMQVSRSVSASEGVEAALVAMATELNIDLLVGMGFEQPQAGPNDLVVAVRGVDDAAVQRGLAALEAALAELRAAGSRSGGLGEPPPPLTTRSALRSTEASLAFVSVPGPSAFVEAMDAVEAGTSVMVFSDNVPVDQEIALKQAAAERDVLVMGPDCGTAMVAGAALGFANVVRPGPVGLVAASGTG